MSRNAKDIEGYGTYLVAIGDVLGFSNLINTKSLYYIDQQYTTLFDKIKDETYGALPQDVAKFLDENSTIFSDTMLFWIKINVEEPKELIKPFGYLIEGMNMMLYASIQVEFPLRIGISMGEGIISPDRKRFLGKAIVNTNKVCNIQEWIGGCLLPQGDIAITSLIEAQKNIDKNSLLEYLIPTKIGEINGYALNFLNNIFKPPLDKSDQLKEFKEHLSKLMYESPIDSKLKYQHTFDFIEYLLDYEKKLLK